MTSSQTIYRHFSLKLQLSALLLHFFGNFEQKCSFFDELNRKIQIPDININPHVFKFVLIRPKNDLRNYKLTKMGDLVDFRRTGNGYSKSVFTCNKYYPSLKFLFQLNSDAIRLMDFQKIIPGGQDPKIDHCAPLFRTSQNKNDGNTVQRLNKERSIKTCSIKTR